MAKTKSEFLSAAGKTFQICKAVVDNVLELGGTDKDMQRLLTEPELCKAVAELIVNKPTMAVGERSGETVYSVKLDGSMSLGNMIAAGKYDYVNSDITKSNFLIERSHASSEVELVLVHRNKRMTTTQVKAEIDRRGLQPAKIEHLLALGATHPELQRDFPIVALGSAWLDPDGDVRVPCLWDGDLERRLDLRYVNPGGEWGDDYRFVALRK